MKIILSVVAVCLVMITVSFYIPKVEAGYGNNHSHNYADRGHNHNYADRGHQHRTFGSNYADANHDHDYRHASRNHDHNLDRTVIKRIIESCSISANNNINCGY